MAAQTQGLRLDLYIAGTGRHDDLEQRLREVLDAVLKLPYELRVIDVLAEPNLAELAHILITPTLVIHQGEWERRLVGDIGNLTRLQLVLADPPAPPSGG